jgi:hypothetical protein
VTGALSLSLYSLSLYLRVLGIIINKYPKPDLNKWHGYIIIIFSRLSFLEASLKGDIKM